MRKFSGKTSTACEVKLRYPYLSKNWFGANKQLGLALGKGVALDTELIFNYFHTQKNLKAQFVQSLIQR